MFFAAAFVSAIFVGSVWLGKITLPFSILLLPLLLIDKRHLSARLPVATILLLVLGVIMVVQFAVYFGNPAFKWRSDLAIWLPLVFAGATIVALRYCLIEDRQLVRSMMVGGIVTSTIMAFMMVFVPKGTFLLPGQNATKVENDYLAQRSQESIHSIAPKKRAPVVAAPADVNNPKPSSVVESPLQVSPPTAVAQPAGREAFVPKSTQQDVAFYDVKNRARNMLGASNYIAVFLVFLFAVSLFSGLPWFAAAFAVLTLTTLSRFGIIILCVVICVYLARRKINPLRSATCAASLVVVGLVVGFLLKSHVPLVPGTASIVARFEYWRSGIEALSLHPLIGAPRSVFLVELGNSITWNPHNSVLWVAVNFGLVGLAAYCTYLWIVMREIANAAASSDLWMGVFVGSVMAVAWGFEEIIVLTPAFEILMASMYVLAVSKNRLAIT
jgi:hypothetical protein